MVESSPVSKSGITTDATTGERYIPSSVRADGSRRREIRVRPGYKPPEDVELYRNKAAAAWKSRGQATRGGGGGGVPGAEGLKDGNDDSATGATDAKGGNSTVSATSNKNAKRREAKKKAKEDEGGRNVAEIANWRAFAAGGGEDKKKAGNAQQQQKATTEEKESQQQDPEAEKDKKARNLKKKLRQARDLSDKKDQGVSLLPEQLEKIIKINELVRQLDSLGLDSNGDQEDGGKEKKESA